MKPYYEDDLVKLYNGDCMDLMQHGQVTADVIVTDPPYGDTALVWDRTPDPEWIWKAATCAPSLWCFGSFRFWLSQAPEFEEADWRYAQEIVWEKHNGSSFHADRFKRVHEFAVQWYRGEWGSVHKTPVVTMDASPRTVRRKHHPPHMGGIDAGSYQSEDGGPRLMRSVLQVRSEHGRAVHPTQKPLGILRPLITYSCPVDGVVLDPFAGSGSTLLAARELGRHAIGIEVREDYCRAAAGRLAQMEMAA